MPIIIIGGGRECWDLQEKTETALMMWDVKE